jgi:hypothetical protein
MAYAGAVRGIATDDAAVLEWTRKSAEQGYAPAQVQMGYMYRQGTRALKKDDGEALKWMRKAAEQGDPSGQVELGLMYELGEGVPKDDAEAVKWYKKAADQGLHFAQFDLAYMYENGKGIAKNRPEALRLYESAAAEVPTALWNLALIYLGDDGFDKDLVKAYRWALLYVTAEALRDPKGRGRRRTPEEAAGRALALAEKVGRQMTKDQRDQAVRAAAEWLKARAATDRIINHFRHDADFMEQRIASN